MKRSEFECSFIVETKKTMSAKFQLMTQDAGRRGFQPGLGHVKSDTTASPTCVKDQTPFLAHKSARTTKDKKGGM